MAVKVKVLSDRRNLNDMRVTAAFIEKVAADHQQYKSQTEVEQAVPMTASANGLVQQGGMQMAGNKSDHPYHKLVKDLTL